MRIRASPRSLFRKAPDDATVQRGSAALHGRDGRTRTVSLCDLFAMAQTWAYRIGGFALLHVMEDPAWLALMFC
jgi:hypothetical protein